MPDVCVRVCVVCTHNSNRPLFLPLRLLFIKAVPLSHSYFHIFPSCLSTHRKAQTHSPHTLRCSEGSPAFPPVTHSRHTREKCILLSPLYPSLHPALLLGHEATTLINTLHSVVRYQNSNVGLDVASCHQRNQERTQSWT